MKHSKRKTGANTMDKNRGEEGFTLVEMLVAITVLALSLLAVGPLLSTALNLDKDSQMKVKSQALAAYMMDQIVGQGPVTTAGCVGAGLSEPQSNCEANYNCQEFINADTDFVYQTEAEALAAGASYVIRRDLAISPAANATQLCHLEVTTCYVMKGDKTLLAVACPPATVGELKSFRIQANKVR